MERTLEILANAPLEDIASDSVTGLLRLSSVIDRFKYTLGVSVGKWEFHDIMGVIAHYGLCREDLLQVAINCAHPTCVSVGKLLDDDMMQRVY